MRRVRLYLAALSVAAAGVTLVLFVTRSLEQQDELSFGTLGTRSAQQRGVTAGKGTSAGAPYEQKVEVIANLSDRSGENRSGKDSTLQDVVVGSSAQANVHSAPEPSSKNRPPDRSDDAGTTKDESHPDSKAACWQLSSNLPERYYSVDQDKEQAFDGESSARITSTSSKAQFGTLSQTINAAAFAGKRVEFSAFIRFENVTSGVSLWVFATDVAGSITVSQRLDWVSGSHDWYSRSIVVDIPGESVALTYAFNISGEGTLWVDDARIAAVGEGVAATFPPATLVNGQAGSLAPPNLASLPTSAANTDFEAWKFGDGEQLSCGAGEP
jgi:hypothetical protein